MEELRRLDQVAYVRFASVYREFADVTEFLDELSPLVRELEDGEVSASDRARSSASRIDVSDEPSRDTTNGNADVSADLASERSDRSLRGVGESGSSVKAEGPDRVRGYGGIRGSGDSRIEPRVDRTSQESNHP